MVTRFMSRAWLGVRLGLTAAMVGLGTFGIVLPPEAWAQQQQQEGAASPPPMAAAPATGDGSVTEADLRRVITAMNAAARAAEDALERLPTWSFSSHDLAQHLGPEADDAFAWVRDHTQFVPYTGGLRGAEGVMMDRLGNSLDRSLLLARLLEQHDHPVRLMHATLGDDAAARLAGAVRETPPTLFPEAYDPAELPAPLTMEQAVQRYGVDLDQGDGGAMAQSAHEQVVGRTLEQSQLLLDVLHAHLAATADEAAGEAADDGVPVDLATWRDHWWVQVELDGSWRDLDPLLPSGQAGTSVLDAMSLPAEEHQPWAVADLPDELFHAVRLRVEIEQLDAGRLTRTVVFDHRLRPADVVGQPVHLVLHPIGLDEQIDLDRLNEASWEQALEMVRNALQAQTEWVPVLTVGGEEVLQQGFTVAGQVVASPRLWERSGSAQLQAAIGALGALGADAPEATGELAGVWLQIDLDVPAPQQALSSPAPPPALTSARRMILDLLQPEQRADGSAVTLDLDEAQRLDRAARLNWESELLLMPCRLSPAYVQREALEAFIANRQGTLKAIHTLTAAEGGLPVGELVKQTVAQRRPPLDLYAFAILRHAWSPVGDSVYLDRPQVVARHQRLTLVRDDVAGLLPKPTGGLDVVFNQVAVPARLPDVPQPLTLRERREMRLRQGVADTVVEAAVVEHLGSAALLDGMTNQTSVQFERVVAGLETWQVLHAEGHDGLGDWPVDARERLRERVASGSVLLAAPPEADVPTFWSVDPASGTTIGINADGWGGSPLSEFLLILSLGVAVTAVASTAACLIYEHATSADSDDFNAGAAGCFGILICGLMMAVFLYIAAAVTPTGLLITAAGKVPAGPSIGVAAQTAIRAGVSAACVVGGKAIADAALG